MATYSVNWSATLSSSSGTIAVGTCLVMSSAGLHFAATTANRSSYGRTVGLAATAGDANNPTVQMIEAGIIPPSITGLAAGSVSWVRASSTGVLERCTPGSGDDIVGKAHADGSVQFHPGVWDSANYSGGGGGGGTAPTGDGFYHVTAGTMDAAATALTFTGDTTGTGTAASIALTTVAIQGIAASVTAPTAGNTLSATSGSACAWSALNLAGGAGYITGTLPVGNGGTGITALGTGVATFLGTPSGANLATALTTALPATKGGTGLTALGTNVATFLGTPSGANLASALTTALPDTKGGTGLTALGSGVATMLGTFSSANIKTACSDETGSGGALVFATSPTLTTPVINGQIQGAAVAMGASAIDWSLGTVFTKTLSAGANTFTFSNQASGMVITVRVTGAASTLTWPTVKWAGGAAPTQTASGIDVYTFVHDGTSVYGSVVQAMA